MKEKISKQALEEKIIEEIKDLKIKIENLEEDLNTLTIGANEHDLEINCNKLEEKINVIIDYLNNKDGNLRLQNL